jgi:hypothetical protein
MGDCTLNIVAHGHGPFYLRLSSPNGGQSTADYAGRVVDARTQAQQPNLILYPNETQRFSAADLRLSLRFHGVLLDRLLAAYCP